MAKWPLAMSQQMHLPSLFSFESIRVDAGGEQGQVFHWLCLPLLPHRTMKDTNSPLKFYDSIFTYGSQIYIMVTIDIWHNYFGLQFGGPWSMFGWSIVSEPDTKHTALHHATADMYRWTLYHATADMYRWGRPSPYSKNQRGGGGRTVTCGYALQWCHLLLISSTT